MKKIIIVIVALAMLCYESASAQTVHVINFCNTLEKQLGTVVDYERMNQEAGNVAAFLNYKIEYYTGQGEDCSIENLNTVLNSLTCEKNDIIMFYYSGHGSRRTSDKGEWPLLCLKYNGYQSKNWIYMDSVITKLKNKGAYFTLIMADCCNSDGTSSDKSMLSNDMKPATDEAIVRANYRKLFLGYHGTVAVTSSKRQQTSLGNVISGGLFSYRFFGDALYSAIHGTSEATWESVLSKTSSMIKAKQEPHYEIYPYTEPVTPPSTPTTTQPVTTVQTVPTPPSQPQQTVMATDHSLARALSSLLDGRQSKDAKLRMASSLTSNYFTNNAKVLTVGRNGTTAIELESAEDFLQRLALSNLIKQIVVISEIKEPDGKRSYIKVQEIRKEK